VELLVVIGIIAVLIGILLPAMGAARRAAQNTQCLAIQREIGMAANMHAGTHQGYYPLAGAFVLPYDAAGVTPALVNDPSRRRYSYSTWKQGSMGGLTLAPWQAAVAQYLGNKKSLNGGTTTEQLDQEIGLNSYLKYFVCPSHIQKAGDLPDALVYLTGSLGWMVQQSYVVNEIVFGFNDDAGQFRGQASKIRRPSATVMLADGLPGKDRGNPFDRKMGWVTFVNKVPTLPQYLPITLADALADNTKAGDAKSFDKFRHRGKINVLYFDGHAETLNLNVRDLSRSFLAAN
jgi:prepilin-type processing-associated H-X9-DG protein